MLFCIQDDAVHLTFGQVNFNLKTAIKMLRKRDLLIPSDLQHCPPTLEYVGQFKYAKCLPE